MNFGDVRSEQLPCPPRLRERRFSVPQRESVQMRCGALWRSRKGKETSRNRAESSNGCFCPAFNVHC
ncbi:unnamed protein product [Rangifer tarandus platyrhynchus]|uniref:Uncharacterized protein n=1 Tax=Rangifer tarandus platyrhynchus TaxID=3082113 RepID=A0ABN8XM11_RANTA|nr:unnamed protein product [Rangifer tarandus platyrhynchus]